MSRGPFSPSRAERRRALACSSSPRQECLPRAWLGSWGCRHDARYSLEQDGVYCPHAEEGDHRHAAPAHRERQSLEAPLCARSRRKPPTAASAGVPWTSVPSRPWPRGWKGSAQGLCQLVPLLVSAACRSRCVFGKDMPLQICNLVSKEGA